MDSENDPDIKVDVLSGTWMRFVVNEIDLHKHDIRGNDDSEHSNTESASSNNAKQKINNY